MAVAASQAMADPLADCSRGRNAEVRLRACSEVIAGSAFGSDDKAVAYRSRGNARAALRNRIGTFGADLLSMGTHARSRLSTAIVGSLAQEFLTAAPCDVLVARG
jgi:nucleotide-binding universal stress UspA family protein